jgi:hypothetical protein
MAEPSSPFEEKELAAWSATDPPFWACMYHCQWFVGCRDAAIAVTLMCQLESLKLTVSLSQQQGAAGSPSPGVRLACSRSNRNVAPCCAVKKLWLLAANWQQLLQMTH